jgi:hypothetical protein
MCQIYLMITPYFAAFRGQTQVGFDLPCLYFSRIRGHLIYYGYRVSFHVSPSRNLLNGVEGSIRSCSVIDGVVKGSIVIYEFLRPGGYMLYHFGISSKQ